MNIDARFLRHNHLISHEGQERICNSSIAIGGVGGIGSAVALMCAKAGFGHLIVCDRDKYELANIVEQAFAMADTVDHDKTSAAAAEIKRHNPGGAVTAIQREIVTAEDARAVVENADVVVSGVDNPVARMLLERAAHEKRVPFLVPANIGWGVLYQAKLPGGNTSGQRRLGLPGVKLNAEGTMPDIDDPKTREILQVDWDIWIAILGQFDDAFNLPLLRGEATYYPYMAAPAFFVASLCVNELIKLVAENNPTITGSNVFLFDLKTCKTLDWRTLSELSRRLLLAFLDGGRDALVGEWINLRGLSQTAESNNGGR